MNELINYNITESWLKEQAELTFTIGTIVTKDDRDSAWRILKVIKAARTGVEKKRKELTSDALKHQRNVNSQAKGVTAAIKEIEEPLAAKILLWDEAIEMQKEAARKIEGARVQKHADSISRMMALGVLSFGDTSVEIKERLVSVSEATPVDELEEFKDEYIIAYNESLATLNKSLEFAIESEKAKEVLVAEQKKLDEEKSQSEADAKELAELRAEKERKKTRANDVALECAKQSKVVRPPTETQEGGIDNQLVFGFIDSIDKVLIEAPPLEKILEIKAKLLSVLAEYRIKETPLF